MRAPSSSQIPGWSNEDAVLQFFDEHFAEVVRHLQLEREFAMPRHAQGDKYFIRKAVQAAREGDFRPLRALTETDVRDHLPEEAWKFINDRLDGMRIGKRGRKRMTAEDRRAMNPIHEAAELVPYVQELLREYYPQQSKQAIRDRALIYAERLAGMSDNANKSGSRVVNYMRSSRNDSRRIK